MRLKKAVRTLYRTFVLKEDVEYTRFVLADKIASLAYPKYTFSEYGRVWMDDRDFLDYYHRFVGTNLHSADRKFFLRSLLNLVEGLPGDTAECGAYLGASSWLICERFRETEKTHFVFDSFEGLSAPTAVDGTYWTTGDLYANEGILRERLASYRVQVYKGWIPDRFPEVCDRRFCFVHVDVDLYQPTHDSLEFFYPRMVPGGIILCDDYGFVTCPGAKRAFDEFLADKPEKIVHVPTGQGFVIKV